MEILGLKVHNIFPKVTFPRWLHPLKIWLHTVGGSIMGNTQKFQIVYAGPTNLCQHSTTDLVRGMTTNERKQSALSKP